MINTIDNYLAKMGVTASEEFSHEDATKLANENVISYYKGRVNLIEVKVYTGNEIAEKLSFLQSHFETEFNKAWKKEFGDEDEDSEIE